MKHRYTKNMYCANAQVVYDDVRKADDYRH